MAEKCPVAADLTLATAPTLRAVTTAMVRSHAQARSRLAHAGTGVQGIDRFLDVILKAIALYDIGDAVSCWLLATTRPAMAPNFRSVMTLA